MKEQNIIMTAYTDSGIFNGILSLPEGGRLSDFINISSQFIHLKGGTANNAADNSDEICINKDAIRLLITATNDSARGSGAKGKTYPYVDKKQMPIKIYMPSCEISGNLYSF
jgi:hypothetical protein